MRQALRAFLALLILGLLRSEANSSAPGSQGARTPGFRLLARAKGALVVNQVYCGLLSDGQICADTSQSNIGGGFWPKGTADQYIFNSGLQVAGIIGGIRSENPWAGDTASGSFFNPRGPRGNGEQVLPIYNSTNPADAANWPAAAYVPDEPNEADNLFHPTLRGRLAASEGDVWWLTWDGNPGLNDVRLHPLGLVLEQRGMAWNTPSGNQDIIYFVYTLYNITSTRAADYVGVRPAMREILLQRAKEFQERNNAAFGITLPANGYPIIQAHLAFGADMDVGFFDRNYASVNIPFALGYTYLADFSTPDFWTFDPEIFGPPFFAGTGFAGVKYLRSPRDSLSREAGLTVFGGYINPGFGGEDPASSSQLYRFLSGATDPAAGDPPCNAGDPKITHICFINNTQPADMRFFQATGPLTIQPGGFESIVVAYIFAAPLPAAGCDIVVCEVRPGNPTVLGNPDSMAAGVNPVDSMTGYRGFADMNHDGRVEQNEFKVVPRSLLDKALVAQQLFDNQFAMTSSAPAAPDFFLIPGSNQVAVIWRPSATEATGDPSFEIVSHPTRSDGTPDRNYDPNFRQFDVEGYRIYRGRVDTPSQLQLIAQFDFAGTVMADWRGQVNPSAGCAPELGINTITVSGTDTTFGCPVAFDSVLPGVAPTVSDTIPLVGPIVQVKLGEGRQALATGLALMTSADTALTGSASDCAAGGGGAQCELRDTGVPFEFVDRGVRNDLSYFYTVTAFDMNSIQSGPSSLESPRVSKRVTPTSQASNLERSITLQVKPMGRGVELDTAATLPTLDPGTGEFSGPFPPANAYTFGLGDLVQVLLPDVRSGSVSLVLDSLGLGSAYENGVAEPGSPAIFYLTSGGGTGSAHLQVPVAQDQTSVSSTNFSYFQAVPIDETASRRFGGGPGFQLRGRFDLSLPGNYYTASWGRGCRNAAAGFDAAGTSGCEYNGPRWFDGPSPQRNETVAHPQASHPENSSTPGPMNGLGNGGALSGVATIQLPRAYETAEAGYRVVEGILGTGQRAADFNVWWGEGGRIDSVIDVTHNVPVPFDSVRLGASWGVLNRDATTAAGAYDQRPDVLTSMDFTCVEPLRSSAAVQEQYPCAAGPFFLSRTVVSGPVALWDQSSDNSRTAVPRPGAGFGLYVAGNLTMFELAGGLPPAGTVWTLRTYVGAISGGRGAAGDRGPYTFTPQPRPLTAVGVELHLDYTVTNRLRAPLENDLSRVHTVPDPYYVTNQFERTTEAKIIQFVNLPADCIIRIYSSSGVLVTLLEHHSDTDGGSERWNVLNRNNQVVGSGVYFFHIEAGDARRIGRFTVVNFAP